VDAGLAVVKGAVLFGHKIMLTFVVSNSDTINSLFIRILSPMIDILSWYSESLMAVLKS
jgi:hypothetical protein